jgi:hypothetical protein
MKGRTTAFLAFAFCFLPFAFSQEPPTAKPDMPATTAIKPVPLDSEFEELYGDYALLLQEINRIETATGQITITLPVTELRARAISKEKKMQAWVDAHKVGRGWVLDWQKKEFHEPDVKTAVSRGGSVTRPNSQEPEIGRGGPVTRPGTPEPEKAKAAVQPSPSETKK